MTDTIGLVNHIRTITIERFISHMNSVGANIIASYPMAEVQSWTIQREEAKTLISMGQTAVLQMSIQETEVKSPFLLAVCIAHYGNVNNFGERLVQLWAKANAVHANALRWAALSAFVNGLRARTEDKFVSATTIEQIYAIESAAQNELAEFRLQNGV